MLAKPVTIGTVTNCNQIFLPAQRSVQNLPAQVLKISCSPAIGVFSPHGGGKTNITICNHDLRPWCAWKNFAPMNPC